MSRLRQGKFAILSLINPGSGRGARVPIWEQTVRIPQLRRAGRREFPPGLFQPEKVMCALSLRSILNGIRLLYPPVGSTGQSFRLMRVQCNGSTKDAPRNLGRNRFNSYYPRQIGGLVVQVHPGGPYLVINSKLIICNCQMVKTSI